MAAFLADPLRFLKLRVQPVGAKDSEGDSEAQKSGRQWTSKDGDVLVFFLFC